MSVEQIKRYSDGLRGFLTQTLDNPALDGFYESDQNLIKLHGLYQQKKREKNDDGTAPGNSFMVRGRVAGGRLTAEQYLGWDSLADLYGGGSIRLTTRQTIQLHGVVKDDLRGLMQGIHKMNLNTKAACGDVVRNVTQAVNPKGLPELSLLDEPASLISTHFEYRTAAWSEVWLGEKRVQVPGDDLEPLYGKAFLPRKFKIAVTLAGDNGIDIYTNCLAFAATVEKGAITGYFVFVGGGMGMNHNKPETYPRLADLLGYIPADKLIETATAVITVHRDFGDRTNRKHARLKYVVQEKGLDWIRTEVETRQGFAFTQRTLPAWNTPDYLGWHQRVDGTWSLGVHILCGRIIDTAQTKLKSALREIASKYKPLVQCTADQDLLLLGIRTEDKAAVEKLLIDSGYAWQSESRLFDRALACVALPTCGLALAEAERGLADVLHAIDTRLEKYGLKHRAPIVRMTGCPNGCARPYAAEIGIVGQLPNKYAIFIGGNTAGTSLARLWLQKVPSAEIADVLDPLFALWKNEGIEGEHLGDFVARMGWEKVAKQLENR